MTGRQRNERQTDGQSPVVAITGATGYLGSLLENAFSEAGYSVRRLIRSPRLGTDDRPFSLGDDIHPGSLEDVDTLVHCAYDLQVTRRVDIWKRNVFGTVELLDAAKIAGTRRTVVISSMSAYPGTRQLYGRAKLEVELAALARGMTVVRPGLVYGPGWGGMAGTLRRLSRLPILPDFGPKAVQFMVHEDDVSAAIVALAEVDLPPRVAIGLAHPEAVPFRHLLTVLADRQPQSLPHFIPVPPGAVLSALRAVELAAIPLPIRADSLLGLMRPAAAVPHTEILPVLGVELRPFRL